MADQFLKPPKPLEQSSKEAWDEWIEAFIWYEKAVQLEKKPQEVQVAIFMASIGQLAQKIYKTFKLNEGEENKLQELKGKFNEYFTPKLNYTVERYQFNNIKQCNEPFKEFLTKVKLQAKKCKFDQMEDELIKDRIVVGIQNNDVREKLLSDPDLNITKAIQICVAAENANTQLREIKDRKESEPSISTIERKISRDFSQKAFNPRDTTSFKKLINNCTRCGAKHEINKCPAYGKVCHKCKKANHFSKLCKTAKRERVVNLVEDTEVESDEFSPSINEIKTRNGQEWLERVTFKGNQTVEFKLDTGAQCNVIPLTLSKKLKLKINSSEVRKLLTYSGESIRVMGETNVTCTIKKEIKIALKKAPALKFFNPNAALTMSVDASSHAIGAVLMQDNRPIAFASATLIDYQRNYPQIEKEALAIKFGCRKFHEYNFGRPILVETDHKPLETIFKKCLSKSPLRLQRILLELQPYDLKVKYVRGKDMFIADLLSRDCVEEEKFENEHLEILLCISMPQSLTKNELVTATETSSMDYHKEMENNGPPPLESEHASPPPVPTLLDKTDKGPHPSTEPMEPSQTLPSTDQYALHASTREERPTTQDVWIIDSACTSHMTSHGEWMEHKTEERRSIQVAEEGRHIESASSGSIQATVQGKDKLIYAVTLHNVLHVPHLKRNPMSIPSVVRRGNSVLLNSEGAYIYSSDDKLIGTGNFDEHSRTAWHRRLGHPSDNKLDLILKNNLLKDLDSINGTLDQCDACSLGKMTKVPYVHTDSNQESYPFGAIYVDLCGPMRINSLGGSKYFLTIVDGFYRRIFVEFLKDKLSAAEVLKKFIVKRENELKSKLKRLTTDNGTEFINKNLETFIESKGIKHELTTPYTPRSNGRVERANRTLLDKGRTLLEDSQLPLHFWAEAVNTAAYLYNLTPTTNDPDTTPMEKWKGKKPSVSHIMRFGCEIFYKLENHQRHKLEAKSKRGIFVGYSRCRRAYRVSDITARVILETADIHFKENNNVISEEKQSDNNTDTDTYFFIQEDEQLDNHVLSDVDIEEPAPDTLINRQTESSGSDRPQRTRTIPKRFDDYVLATTNETIPKDYKEAIACEDKKHWENAMLEEIQNMYSHQKIAEKCEFPDVEDRLRDALVCGILSEEIQSMLLMNSMLTFKVAQEMALAHEAAVRNVAEIKDGKPQEEINVMGRAVKVRRRNEKIFKCFRCGYTNHREEQCFFKEKRCSKCQKLGHISRVCKNGNWRSDRNNNCSIDEEAEATNGLFNINQVKDTSNMRNYMVKVRTSGRDMNMLIDSGTRKNIISEKTYIRTWVKSERPRIEKDYTKLVQWNRQRLSILGKIKADVKVNKRSITMEFLVIEGPGPNLIGREAFDQIGIGLEWMNYGDSVCQINEVMNGNGMAAAMNGNGMAAAMNGTANGMMSGANGMGAGYMNGGEGMYNDNCDQHTYQEALGMLMFLAVNTRPDIAYITSKLSQYSRQPKQMHWTAIKRVMRYLRGTIDLGVKFERGKTGILKSYTDASWSTTHDGKSYGGYVLKLGEATIDWKSSKQPLVALSTMEAEMIAACESCCQIKWIINLLQELEEWNFMEKPTAIYTDSQSLINWSSSPKQSSRCRHINRKYHFLRDCYESRDICLLYKPSQDLEADIFTKDLSRDQKKKHLENLSIVGIKTKTRSGLFYEMANADQKPLEAPTVEAGVTTGGDAGFDPIPFNPSLNIRKYAGDEDPRQWITSLEEVGFLYRWADYIITRYAAMNLVGPAKTWYEFHKVNLATWEIFKTRLIQDFASLENKDEMMLKLNRMQGWNELAMRFAEDILLQCSKVQPNMEEMEKIQFVIGGLKKEYALALYLNPPKTIDELLEACKRIDGFEKEYLERKEKNKILMNRISQKETNHARWNRQPREFQSYKTENYSRPMMGTPRQNQTYFPPQETRTFPRSTQRDTYRRTPSGNTYDRKPRNDRVNQGMSKIGAITEMDSKSRINVSVDRIGILEALVDTGADLSIVDLRTALETGVRIETYNGKCIGPDGKRLNILGSISMDIKIDEKSLNHRFVVLESNMRSLIIGRDLLRRLNAKINCKRDILEYDIVTECQDSNEAPRKIINQQDEVVPRLCVKLVRVTVKAGDGEYVVEPNERLTLTNGLRIARCLITVRNKLADLWITNPYPRTLKIMKNQTLGYASPPTTVNYIENDEEDKVTEIQINEDLTLSQKNELRQVLSKYSDLFSSKLGKTNLAKHRIETENAKPIKHKPYRVSPKERDIIKEQIQDMLQEGVIRASSSPWAFPVILVRKRDGNWRFCVDYRKLNSITVKDVYPIPRIDDVMDTLQGSRYFTAIDLRSGYWQVEIEEQDKKKTAFTTSHGLYEFNVMPFGLCNAPATFERIMDNVLKNIKWKFCLCYLDDVVIYSPDFTTHLGRIEAVLKCFRESNLRLNGKKCRFGFEEIEILGHVTSKHGIKPADHNVKAIRDFPRPSKTKEIQSFIGLCSYYRKFIKNFSRIADPLFKLTRKDSPFIWSESQEEAFITLKSLLTNPPILSHFDPEAPTQIHTDASNIGLGATLVQTINGQEKVISYISRSLSKPERNYSTTEKECLALVWSMSKLRPYLYGRRFKVMTDHHALCWLRNLRDPTGRLARWALKIQEYDFEIIYKSGKKHLDADGLSRGPLPEADFDDNYDSLFFNPVIEDSDEYIENIKRCLGDTEGKRSIVENFKEENGCLYKRNPRPEGRAWLLVVPRVRRRDILKEYHNHMICGHLGVTRTMHRLKDKYFWPSMLKDVVEYVRTCHLCQSRKGSNQLPAGLLHPIPAANYPFERVGIDLLGPLPSTKNRKKWMIVLTDYYTKYAETKAVIDATAREVAKFLTENVILKHGAPRYLISDRGSQFTSNLVKEITKICQIQHCLTTSYHPQTNGLTERLNRTLINMISMYVNVDQRNWDEILPFITHAYNTTIQETTKYSPFFLLYGREPVSILDDTNIFIEPDSEDYD
ncbi:hypothetical protein LAZ67_2006034, partial [Cordylochernes scorpioides]